MYKIEFSSTAAKVVEWIAHADRLLYSRIMAAIESLARDPYQGKQLKGPLRTRRSLRVGSYRIVYVINKNELTVIVIDLGHRKDIYR